MLNIKKQKRVVLLGMLLLSIFLIAFAYVGLSVEASGEIIVINPGHMDGVDPGAVNDITGIREVDLNNALAIKTVTTLRASGYNAMLSHPIPGNPGLPTLLASKPDYSVYSKTITEQANEDGIDLLISLHHNSGGNASGYETYWSSYHPSVDTDGIYQVFGLWPSGESADLDNSPSEIAIQSRELAISFNENFKNLDYVPCRNKITERDDSILRRTSMPSVLIEAGFVSNDAESLRMAEETNQQKMADQILISVNTFFENEPQEMTASDIEGSIDENKINIKISGIEAPNGIKRISVPVWSEAGGQDDIVWYTAVKQSDGSYTVNIDPKNHKNDLGIYNIHVYGVDNSDKTVMLGTTTVDNKNKEMTASDIEGSIDENKINIKISGIEAPNGIKRISVPVWSEAGGQDDIVWYTAVKQSDGSYTVNIDPKNHKNDLGIYNIHVYGVDNSDKTVMLGTTTVDNKNKEMTASDIEGSIDENKINIKISGIEAPNGIKRISVPVWSEAGGQDDIVWYTAVKQSDGSYTVNIDPKNHKNDLGIYNIHVYGVDNSDKTVMLGTTTVDNKNKEMTASDIEGSIDENKINIKISGIEAPNGIKRISVPVWSEAGGQDDIVWYTAVKQSDGSYTVNIDPKNHKNDLGIYNIHVYGVDNSDKTVMLGTTTVDNKNKEMTASDIEGSIDENKINIKISGIEAPNGIKRISVPVWSEAGGQDDIVWYTAVKQSDGSYTVNIDPKNHKNDLGIYNIHVYGVDNSDKTVMLGTTTVDNKNKEMTASDIEGSIDENKINIKISGIEAPNGIKRISVPVWSEAGGQDDIVWYTAVKQSDGSYTVNIDPKNHKNDLGIYNIHVYGVDNSDKTVMLGTTTVDNKNKEMTASDIEGSIDENKINIKISGIEAPNGIKRISVPVWSEAGGQDDIVWYTAVKQSDGSYTVNIDPKNHKNDLGIYNIHVYGVDNSDKTVMLGTTTAIFDENQTETPIMGVSVVTAQKLIDYYNNAEVTYPQEYIDRDVDLETFVNYYIQEAEVEGVRADVAFAQAMIETGNLQFGGDVKVGQFNFAGLGATGGGESGFDFANEYGDNAAGIRMGVRAHVQHLKCYASDLPLNQENIDPRWGEWIRLRATTVEELAGTWAMDSRYAVNLLKIINQF